MITFLNLVEYRRTLKIILLGLLTTVFVSKTYSSVPYDINWKIIQTPNFQIIFDENHERLAQDVANKSESAKKTLEQVFTEFPKKTVVVINDYDDTANGFAINFPYPIITIRPVLPSPLTTIYNYDDWIFSIMLHEYVHTVSLYQQKGFWKLLGTVFGNKVFPISLMPRWYIEGLAVDIESSYSKSSGRLNDPRLYANARAMLLDDKWGKDNIYTVNESSIPTWPLGHRPYMYGGMILNQAKQDSSLETINQNHSDWILKLYTSIKLSYETYLNKAYQQVGLTATEQIKTIQSSNTQNKNNTVSNLKKSKDNQNNNAKLESISTSESLFSKDGIIHHSPEISDDGKHMLFVRQTDNVHSQIILVQRDDTNSFINGEQKKLLDAKSINRVSWINNTEFVYNAIETYKNYYNYSDLFIGNIDGSKRRLTRGARLGFAAPLNKDKLLAVQIDADINNIVTFDLNTSKIEVLYKTEQGVKLSYPTVFSDSEILFNEKSSGVDLIKAFDLNSNVVTHLKGAKEKALFLSKVKDGFFYSSQISGVSNLYFWSYKKRNSWPITNSITEILNGTWDEISKEIIYSELKSDGYHLVGEKSSLEAVKTPKIKVPHIEPVVGKQPAPEKQYEITSYNHFQHLIPKYWFPSASLSNSKFVLLANTSGEDPTGTHRFDLNSGISIRRATKKPQLVGEINYNNYMLPVRTNLLLSSDIEETLRKNTISLNFNKNLTQGNELVARLGLKYEQYDSGVGSFGPTVGLLYEDIETKRNNGYIVRTGGGVGVDQWYRITNSYINNNTTLYSRLYLPVLDSGHEVKLGTAHSYVATTLESGSLVADLPVACMTRAAFRWPSYSSTSEHILRGYNCGFFRGLHLHSLNFEYKLPALKIYKNLMSSPIFLKNLYVGFVADNLFIVDGVMPNELADADEATDETNGEAEPKKYETVKRALFQSVGLEASLSFTALYHVPASIKVGYYHGLVTINGKHQSSLGVSLNMAGF